MARGPRTPRVALATCAKVPDLDDGDGLLRDALVELGVVAEPAVWDDPAVPWGSYDLLVVRSTWDYPERVDEFLVWAGRVATLVPTLNELALLRWSTDKHYLDDLAAAGVPTVPSVFLAPGAEPEHPWLDAPHVVKPSVGAGSRAALRFGAADADRSRAHVRHLHEQGRTALAQPYLDSVDTLGETALVYLDGTLSHAMRKGPLLAEHAADLVDGLYVREQLSPRDASAAELALGTACLAALPDPPARPPLYARVDLLASVDGPVVLELELVEPSLFLEHAAGSADRLAGAIVARLPRPPGA